MLTVEQFEIIRRKYYVDGMSRRAIARELGHARKTVDKAITHSSPPGYALRTPRRRPVLEAVKPIIRAILEQDQNAPAKQRHSATRIYERLKEEHGFVGSEVTVRRCVRELRGAQPAPTFLVLSFEPGEEAQVDWGEAVVIENGQEQKVYLFEMRLSYSKASFIYPYRQMTSEAFLDGHVRALEYFGAVPRRLAYDNLKAAVVQVCRQQRRLNEAFKQLRSHYLFESRFCNVAAGNEKGDVENLVKRSKSSYLTPPPQVRDLEALAELLLQGCQRDLERIDRDQSRPRRDLLEEERRRMLPLPPTRFLACRQQMSRVSKQALVRFENNDYSVPEQYAYRACVVRAFTQELVLLVEQQEVARHRRCYQQGQYLLDPNHYLQSLSRKPGALDNALAFKALLKEEALQVLRKELQYRHGPSGDRQFIAILQLRKDYPAEAFARAIQQCVRQRLFAVEAIRSVLREEAGSPAAAVLDLSARQDLQVKTRGLRSLGIYSQLLSSVVPTLVAETPPDALAGKEVGA